MDKMWIKASVTLFGTLLVLMLTLFSGLVAPFALICGLIAAIFIGYLYIGCGGIWVLLSGAVVSGGVFLLSGGAADALLLVAIGFVPGIVSGILQKHKMEYYEVLFGVSLSFGAVLMAILYVAGMGIDGGIGGFFDETAKMMKGTLSQIVSTAGITEITAEEINLLVEQSIKLVKRTIPSVIIIFSAIFGYIQVMSVRFLAKQLLSINVDYVKFDNHIAPKHISYVYFIAMGVLFFGKADGIWSITANNLISVFDFILAFCGFSFIESKLKEKLKFGVLRGIIYVFVFTFLSSIAMQLLAIVGMIDSFFDFRRIKRIGEK